MLELLAAQRLGVEVVGRPQHRDEEFSAIRDRQGGLVVDRDRETGEVDEELLAREVVLAHHDVEVTVPLPVELAELAVAVAVGVSLTVLIPEQLQGDALVAQFALQVSEVGDFARQLLRRRREEQALKGVVVEVTERPREPCVLGTLLVERHRGVGHRDGRRHVAQTQLLAPPESKYLADLAHGCMGTGHRRLL
jgi:hypothetical protein